jgi:hypothetical protein
MSDQFVDDPSDPDEWLRESRRRDAVGARRVRADERAIQSDEATLLTLCESARIESTPVTLTTTSAVRSGRVLEVSNHFVALSANGAVIVTPTGALRAVSTTGSIRPAPLPRNVRSVREWLDDAVIDRPEVQVQCAAQTISGVLEWVGADLMAIRILRGGQREWSYVSTNYFDELMIASG